MKKCIIGMLFILILITITVETIADASVSGTLVNDATRGVPIDLNAHTMQYNIRGIKEIISVEEEDRRDSIRNVSDGFVATSRSETVRVVRIKGTVQAGSNILVDILGTDYTNPGSEYTGGLNEDVGKIHLSSRGKIGEDEQTLLFENTRFNSAPKASITDVIQVPMNASSVDIEASVTVGTYYVGAVTYRLVLYGEFEVIGGSGQLEELGETIRDIVDTVIGHINNLPLPKNERQALVGILLPAVIASILGSLSNLGGVSPLDPSIFTGGKPPLPELRIEAHDSGQVFEVKDGKYIPIRDLREGEAYVNPDGERRIWVGDGSLSVEEWEYNNELERSREEYWEQREAENKQRLEDWRINEQQFKERPCQYMAEQFIKINQRETAVDRLIAMRRTARRNDLDKEGSIDNMVERIEREIASIDNGNDVDVDRLVRIRKHIGDRITGRTLGPDYEHVDTNSLSANAGYLGTMASETFREISTGSRSDGSFSLGAMVVRSGLGYFTGGASEWVLSTAGGLYTVENAIKDGHSYWGAMKRAAFEQLASEGVGRLIGGAASGITGGKRGLQTWVNSQASEISDLFTPAQIGRKVSGMGNSAIDGASRINNRLFGNSKPNKFSSLNHADQVRIRSLEHAIKTGNEKAVRNIYRNGGVNQLERLQRQGALSGEMAQRTNEIIRGSTNRALDESARSVLGAEIHVKGAKTKVRIKELMLGDSGSSAKGAPKRIRTDTDVTLETTYDKQTLKRAVNEVARDRKISKQAARREIYQQLREDTKAIFDENVENNLRRSGLSGNDVCYTSHETLGDSISSDSYGRKYVSTRQRANGRTSSYSSKDGRIVQKNLSGDALADQNILNNRNLGQKVPENISKIDTNEAIKVVRRQIKCVKSSNSVDVAKAVNRSSKMSEIIKSNGRGNALADGDATLVDIANRIYDNPSEMQNILVEHGMGEGEFRARSRGFLETYNDSLNTRSTPSNFAPEPDNSSYFTNTYSPSPFDKNNEE